MSVTAGKKIERQWLAHFIDIGFGSTASWLRLGKDLESYQIEANPEVEQKKNILGENSTHIKGYTRSSAVDTYYAKFGDPLYEALYDIVIGASNEELRTKVVDVIIGDDASIVRADQQDCVLVPSSAGGEDGVQIPFTVYYDGNYKDVTASATISNGALTITSTGG